MGFSFWSCQESSDRVNNPALLTRLDSLYQNQNFFTLKKNFNTHKEALSEPYTIYYSALIDNVFNNQASSNASITELLAKYQDKFSDAMLKEVYYAKSMNHLNLYEYAATAKANEVLIDRYLSFFDTQKAEDLKNELGIWQALSTTPKQQVFKTKDCTIPMVKDKVGLMNIDVDFNGETKNFLFDTGANFSVMVRSLVEKLGLEIIEADFYVTAATGLKVDSDLAIAEELTINEITCKNVVFLIIEDEDLSFPQIDYYPNGAIGFPVIEAFEEFHFDKKGHLFVPKKTVEYPYNNLALDGLMPIVSGVHNGDTLRFNFDTGATNTSLYPAYFKRYKQTIEDQYDLTTLASASGGGKVEFQGYLIPEFPLKIANSSAVLDSLRLHIEDIGGEESHFDGNFGQDFIKQFDKMIISFKHSAVVFE
jgi:predicted aspartyl protease